MQKLTKPKNVAILIYDNLCTFEFGLAVEVFATRRPEIENWYNCKTIAAEVGPLRAAGGLTVQCDSQISDLETADLIIVPGWPTDKTLPDNALAEQLHRAEKRGAQIMTICSGVFLAADVGLTKGKTITTHWRYVEQLKLRAPDAKIEENVLYCSDGQLLSSAGSAAGLDLAMDVVRSDFGTKITNSIAQRLVLPAHRDGGQAQFVPRPVSATQQGPLAMLLDKIRAKLDQDWTISEIAKTAAMSERTLIRRFKQTIGQSPSNWIASERVYLARELLEKAEFSIDQISMKSGFKTPETLRHHFRRQLGISPNAYRNQFMVNQEHTN